MRHTRRATAAGTHDRAAPEPPQRPFARRTPDRRKMKLSAVFTLGLWLSAGAYGFAGEADVTAVDVTRTGERTFQFHVTVSHSDEGWKHYADRWEIVAPDGSILGTRTLYHPHDDEQPFTRSLPGVRIPEGIRKVTIRAHDSVHEYGGKTTVVVLPP